MQEFFEQQIIEQLGLVDDIDLIDLENFEFPEVNSLWKDENGGWGNPEPACMWNEENGEECVGYNTFTGGWL